MVVCDVFDVKAEHETQLLVLLSLIFVLLASQETNILFVCSPISVFCIIYFFELSDVET